MTGHPFIGGCAGSSDGMAATSEGSGLSALAGGLDTPGVGGPPDSGARATAKASLPTAAFTPGALRIGAAHGETLATTVSAASAGKAGNRALFHKGPIPRDRTGERYGKLVALSCCGPLHGEADYMWRCDCGAIVRRKGRNVVRSGDTANCGCTLAGYLAATEIQKQQRAARKEAARRAFLDRLWPPQLVVQLRRDWADSWIRNEQLPERLGKTMPAIRAKASALSLGPRPRMTDGKRIAAAVRRGVEVAHDDDAAPVAPVAPGLRQTDRLVRARMLVQRGISVDSIVAGLKLTSVEVAALRGQG